MLFCKEKEPERESIGAMVLAQKYEMPKIVAVPGITFSTHGKFRTKSGTAKGLVVHYTVSPKTEKSAIGVLNSLAKRGLGCPVMDGDGVIYVPQNYDFMRDVVYHAGSSEWQGVSGISQYCIGMEICNWGRLNKDSLKYVRPSDIRQSPGADNIVRGEYEAYTREQEASLINFILWQFDINKEFRADWIVGHDEIAPSRKTDPGASLSMTMPQFRNKIRSLIGV